MMFKLCIVSVLCLFCTPSDAKDLGEWDYLSPNQRMWFQRPLIKSCCSKADGQSTDWEIRQDGYYVPVPWQPKGRANWIRVPDDHVIKSEGNPIGDALIWFMNGANAIRCFIPGDAG